MGLNKIIQNNYSQKVTKLNDLNNYEMEISPSAINIEFMNNHDLNFWVKWLVKMSASEKEQPVNGITRSCIYINICIL